MFGKYFSKKREDDFYLLGEEIKIDKNNLSLDSNIIIEKDTLSVCKNRTIFATLCFILAYLVIAGRVFDLCVTSNQNLNKVEKKISKTAAPTRRADIIDRNGTIIATSLPTVNLYANPRKIIDPERATRELVSALPELDFETTLKKLNNRKTQFEYIKRNLSPAQ